jgi:hypothetical protein
LLAEDLEQACPRQSTRQRVGLVLRARRPQAVQQRGRGVRVLEAGLGILVEAGVGGRVAAQQRVGLVLRPRPAGCPAARPRRPGCRGQRGRQQRAEKLLEDAAIKVSSVVTDLHGVTGREIMDRLIAGERDPKVLAECARTRARRKIPQLREALEGAEFFTAHHARLLQSILNRIDTITAEIDELSAAIGTARSPANAARPKPSSPPATPR